MASNYTENPVAEESDNFREERLIQEAIEWLDRNSVELKWSEWEWDQ